MKHADAIKALDERRTVYAPDDKGWIAALGRYETSQIADHDRASPMNKRGNAFVHWESGVSTWTPIKDLRVTA